jgi:hypothetical protein
LQPSPRIIRRLPAACHRRGHPDFIMDNTHFYVMSVVLSREVAIRTNR